MNWIAIVVIGFLLECVAVYFVGPIWTGIIAAGLIIGFLALQEHLFVRDFTNRFIEECRKNLAESKPQPSGGAGSSANGARRPRKKRQVQP